MSESDLPPKKPKHVIILGAGASATSGYPVADGLRNLMSSPKVLREHIANEITRTDERETVLRQFDEWIKPAGQALQLLREGAFATMDEFCKLSGPKLVQQVIHLKKVLRLALSIHNPEDEYQKSDYYGFVQRLFSSNLVDLRDDIVVFSFNYDVYLEFLLFRAERVRAGVTTRDSKRANSRAGMVTGGFYGRDVDAIRRQDGFQVLKLHGSIAWPALAGRAHGNERDEYCCYDDIFDRTAAERLGLLTTFGVGHSDSPIVFPWEIMTDEGQFMDDKRFPCRDEKCLFSARAGAYDGNATQFELFKAVWERARAEIQAANKISLVGLSLHEYLYPAFKFLFTGKTGNIEIVVADKSLERFNDATDAHFDRLTPVARFSDILANYSPELTWNDSSPMNFGLGPSRIPSRRPMKLRKSFAEFVRTEMGTDLTPQGVIETSRERSYQPVDK